MPFAFLIVGAVMTLAAVQGNGKDLFELLKNDFTGTNNFSYWFITILLIGALGYVNSFRPLSRALLVLIFIVLILVSNKESGAQGVFAKFESAIGSITQSTSLQNIQSSSTVSPSTAASIATGVSQTY